MVSIPKAIRSRIYTGVCTLITKLELRNFQTHSKLVIPISPGITTVVGSSDIGKSSVIRALEWVFLNNPSGVAFLKNGSSQVQVRLRIDGSTVTRSRGKRNLYKLNKQEFISFGTQVPDSLSDFLSTSELNFQNQHDAPFWFGQSAGFVSRQLNEIVNLDEIDRTLTKVASVKRSANTTCDVLREKLKKSKKENTKLFFVNDLDSDLQKLEILQRKIKKKQLVFDSLSEQVASLYQITEQEQDIKRKAGLLEKKLRTIKKVVRKQKERDSLHSLIQDVQITREQLCHKQTRKKQIEKHLTRLRNSTIICPTCTQEVDVSVL